MPRDPSHLHGGRPPSPASQVDRAPPHRRGIRRRLRVGLPPRAGHRRVQGESSTVVLNIALHTGHHSSSTSSMRTSSSSSPAPCSFWPPPSTRSA